MARRTLSPAQRHAAGERAAAQPLREHARMWAEESSDKPEIGLSTAAVLRSLMVGLPLDVPLRAMSIGSGAEPQLVLLEATCAAGVHLLDIDPEALAAVRSVTAHRHDSAVRTVEADLTEALAGDATAAALRRAHLGDQRCHLVAFHHSLYYARAAQWEEVVGSAYRQLVADPLDHGRAAGALHAVLMASASDDPTTTTWMYNHFAGRFCGVANDQDLDAFARRAAGSPAFPDVTVVRRRVRVHFDDDDFERFLGPVWMILLYPEVHRYTADQRAEIVEWVYEHLWSRGVPLVQEQDHVAFYRGAAPGARV